MLVSGRRRTKGRHTFSPGWRYDLEGIKLKSDSLLQPPPSRCVLGYRMLVDGDDDGISASIGGGVVATIAARSTHTRSSRRIAAAAAAAAAVYASFRAAAACLCAARLAIASEVLFIHVCVCACVPVCLVVCTPRDRERSARGWWRALFGLSLRVRAVCVAPSW